MRYAEKSADLSSEIAQLQCAVSALDKLFHFRLGLVQFIGGLSQQLDSFLKEAEACVEVEAVALQLADDLLESLEVGFEGHGSNIECRWSIRCLCFIL